MIYDIVIIGGGASGLCTAIMSKTENNSILIIEHNDRIGKKILGTGNGRCNLTNEYCKVSLFEKNPEGILPYNSCSDLNVVRQIISQFDCKDTINFFEKLGILTVNKNGYYYPRSEQASSVLDTLRIQCIKRGIEVVTDFHPINLKKEKSYFLIDNKIKCRKLVIATGGKSQPKSGSDGSGYDYAMMFGHHIIAPLPSLCGLLCKEKEIKELSGVRCDVSIALYDKNNNEIVKTFGNLQFNNKGLSGIPVFQLSSIAGRLMNDNNDLSISIDFLPEFNETEIKKVIYHKDNDIFLGILNKKIGSHLETIVGNKQKLTEEEKNRLIHLSKNFILHPSDTFSFEESQVTSGGISLKEINPENMMSRITENLYFTGEILDADGICGGYNLQWAWSTAFVASNSLKC